MTEISSSAEPVISILEMTADLYRRIAQAALEAFGEEAKGPLWSGLRRYGDWHGSKLRARTSRGDTPAALPAVIRMWPLPDVQLAMMFDTFGRVSASDAVSVVELSRAVTPKILTSDLVPDFVRFAYVEAPVAGITAALGNVRHEVRRVEPDGSVEYLIRAVGRDQEPFDSDAATPLVVEFPSSASAIRAFQIDAMRCRGAMFVCVARALIDRFDASGERVVRAATRQYGLERGRLARAKHMAAGLEINLKNFVDDYDNPMSVWGWEEGAILTPGRWHATCDFCPHVSAWRELDELELGYLYDYEVHVSLFTSYDPETRVQWGELQTRGDATCQFRFEIPRLLAAEEEAFNGRANASHPAS